MVGRKFALYFSWSRPKEIKANLGILENRYPTLFEFRRAIWPMYEWAKDPKNYSQDISGFLDHVVLYDFQYFEKLIKEVTGKEVSVIQRLDGQPPVKELDEDFLKDIDTLIVVSLDHFSTNQQISSGEIEAVKHFLTKEKSCLLVCPHHDVGSSNLDNLKEEEHLHHGDFLIPGQQRIGGFAKSLLEGLGLPIENRHGLNPAKTKEGNPEKLLVFNDYDKNNILNQVPTFNLHPHLPHLHIPSPLEKKVKVLARQKINSEAESHPFVREGNLYFNSFLWVPPYEQQAGNIYICDATLWSAAFMGLDSLVNLWKNLANL